MSHVADLDILAEEEADRQRVVEETHLAYILKITRQQQEESRRAYEEETRAKRAESQARSCAHLASALNSKLGIEVPVERVRVVDFGDLGQWYPAVEFGGATFAYRRATQHWSEEDQLSVARPCVRGCDSDVWVAVASRADLLAAVDGKHAHDHPCLVQYDEDGEPTTDSRGNSLPPRVPRQPVESAEERHQTALHQYTAAVARRRHLEFARPIEKAAAIKRLMDAQLAKSATAAKEMSHEDTEFAAFCQSLTDAVIEEMQTREALLVARQAAGLSGAGTSSASDEEDAA